MATALQGVRFIARTCQCRPQAQLHLSRSICSRRAFSISSTREADVPSSKQPLTPYGRKQAFKKAEAFFGIETEEDRQFLQWLKEQPREADEDPDDPFEVVEMKQDVLTDIIINDKESEIPHPNLPYQRKKVKATFLNAGEEVPFEDTGFEFEADTHEELTSLAHGELEKHREIRHYARLAAWEMPLLSELAKPFERPTLDTPLKFRYTTYMGEQHPAENKVVVEFCTTDMPGLTRIQRLKLIKLAGVRYNPETDVVKMSCEMFQSQAQNKRYLGDLVNNMLREAKDATDTFEDVPVDWRHHKVKSKPTFPKEWNLSKRRRAQLAQLREDASKEDHDRQVAGQLVDGVKQIQDALSKVPLPSSAVPEMVLAGGKGRAKKISLRR